MNYVNEGGYRSFVCLDFETTGLSGKTDRVTEIGAVKVQEGRVVQRFSTLVNPVRPIPPRVVALTGISNDMVEDHPGIHEILPIFLNFLGDLPLVAHNAKFDCKFLERDLAQMGRSIQNPVADTLTLAKQVCPGLPSYKLSFLTEHFSIPLRDAHRAWCDAEATAMLYLHLQTL
jgi:DNA polymerase-3 subunit alpha (Gram-positive type)